MERGKKERKTGFAELNRGGWDLYTLKINCKGEITVGESNKGMNVEDFFNWRIIALQYCAGFCHAQYNFFFNSKL